MYKEEKQADGKMKLVMDLTVVWCEKLENRFGGGRTFYIPCWKIKSFKNRQHTGRFEVITCRWNALGDCRLDWDRQVTGRRRRLPSEEAINRMAN